MLRFNPKVLWLVFFLFFAMQPTSEAMAQARPMVPETLWEFGRISDVRVSPDANTLLFGVTTYDVAANRGTRDLFVMPVQGGPPLNITSSSTSESSAVWRPDGQKIGYLSAASGSSQLWEMDPDGGNPRQVTNVAGGITGFGYAPGMQHIYYTRRVKVLADISDMHPDLPQANAYIYNDLMYRHWDRWADAWFSHIFIAAYNDGAVGEGKDIMEGEPWHSPVPPFGGSSDIAWLPNGEALVYTCKKLFGKEWTLSTNTNIYLYDLESATTRNLTAFNPGYDKYPAFSPDGSKMAWVSMATPGFESDKSRIMVMDMETGYYRDYSAGFDQSSGSFSWSADGRTLYFISGIHATYQIYALDIDTGAITKLTSGQHNYQSVSDAGDYLVATRMSISMPTEIFRVDKRSLAQEQVSFVNKTVLDRAGMGRVEERWVKTTDNQDMHMWVIYPPDFDPNKKYPAILFCGGGPQNTVSQFFSYRWNFQLMAAHGYVVVAPNRRGLPSFGQEWNDQISQDYGGQNMLDLLSAIDALKAEPFVDQNRLGAAGASYGGFSVFWLAGNHQKRFKAFIAHCGMFNFESWYGTTEEMFFANHDIGGAYWENPRPHSYDFSPHHFAGNWDTPILVIHGAKDYRVPYGEGMQAFNAAQLQGIPSRFMLFPEENHWVLRPQNSILWQREFFKWMDQWLKE